MEWKHAKPLKDVNTITQVEQELGVKFPVAFTEIIKEHNNGSPKSDTFDTEKRTGKAFGELLNFNLTEKYNILYEYSLIKDKLPPNVIPFAGDAGGNYLCFDYRRSADAPTIIRWDHEQQFEIIEDELVVPDHDQEYQYYACDFVANNWKELLEKLYTEDDDEDDDEPAEIIWENFMDEEKLKELDNQNFAQVNARRIQQGLAPLKR
ncbi:SMI1/KNR4 family protein [Mucilaginibacter conchicola]|uniref:SMI1/KNR4 family protein n=1 Tax=Mucilaginibacter conchicola TaxID=2303333 RepID=A0A372NPX3_9SPHI|nr:SMI1/KNR4 family protein [Mucilaginibacter conchicola]RFZ90984.1 SMI1/KNR4 family protein [Mucilaginibacter conchicola]